MKFSEIQSRIDHVKDSRTLWEAQVSTTMHFEAGHQDIWWDKQGNMRNKQTGDNEVFRMINLIKPTLSIHQARMTSNQPQWNVKRTGIANATDREVDAASQLLTNLWTGAYDVNNAVQQKMKMAIRYGFLQGGAFTYNYFDEEKGIPALDIFPLWSIYPDTSAKDGAIENMDFIVIPVARSIDWIKSKAEKHKGKGEWNMKNVNALQADSKMAESKLHEEFIKRKNGNRKGSNSNTVLIYQTFYKKSGKLYYCMYNSGSNGKNKLFEQELIGYTNLGEIFDRYSPVYTEDFFCTPPVWSWIDPQKSFNKHYSGIENYIDCFGVGRWIVANSKTQIPKGGRHGQVIQGIPGQIAQLPMDGLPGSHFEALRTSMMMFEHVSGVNQNTINNSSVESGVGIAQLQAMDENNTADAVDNYKMFLRRIGAKLLKSAANNWNSTKTIYRYDEVNEEEIEMEVIGERAKDQRKASLTGNEVSIRPFANLETEIVVGQFNSSLQMRRDLQEILAVYQPGTNPVADRYVLPMVLKAFNMGSSKALLQDIRSLDDPARQIAMAKAQMIIEGQPVPVHPDDSHELLIKQYQQSIRTEEEKGNQESIASLKEQIAKHEAFMNVDQGAIGPMVGVGGPQEQGEQPELGEAIGMPTQEELR